MYINFVKKFLKYFNITSSKFGRCDLPYNTNTIELSNVSTKLTREIRYYNDVIYKQAFKSQESDAFQTILKQVVAAYKAQIEDLLVTDIYRLSYDQTDNLLASFGFPKASYPMFVKKQLLKILVENYKSKGTLKSTDLFRAILPNYYIYELFYVNDEPSFVANGEYKSSAGDIIDIGITIPYSEAEKDKYWDLTYEDAVNWPYNYAMSPFYVGFNIFDTMANIEAIIKLRSLAKLDLEAYENDPTTYDDRKVLQIDPFPADMSYLDVYLFLQYIYLKSKHMSSISLADKSYMYNKDMSNFEDDFYTDFLQKQLVTKQTKLNIDVKDIKIKQAWTIIVPDNPYEYQVRKFDLGESYEESILSDGNYIVIYTRSENGYQIKIVDKYDPTKGITIDTDIKLIKPAVFYSKGKVILVGGYNLDGTKNYYRYVISLSNSSVTKYKIHEKFWISDVRQVRLNDKIYVLSSQGSCKGCIFQYTEEGIPQKLITQLDSVIFDLETALLIPFEDNKVIVLLWNKVSDTMKMLLLDEQIKHIITDVSCMLFGQLDRKSIAYLFSALKDKNVFALTYKHVIYLYFDNIVSRIEINYQDGKLADYIMPKGISKLLVPCYVDNKRLKKFEIPTQIDGSYKSLINLRISENVDWYHWPFSQLCDDCSVLGYNSYLIRLGIETGIIPHMDYSVLYDSHKQKYDYIPKAVLPDNQYFCNFLYDTDILYDGMVPKIAISDMIIPSCLPLYDMFYIYDDYTQGDVDLQCFLPHPSEEFNDYYPKTFESFYYKVSIPEDIKISATVKTLFQYQSNKEDVNLIHISDFQNPASFFIAKENNHLLVTYTQPSMQYTDYVTDLLVTYDCSNQPDSPLCFVLNRLNDRIASFEEDGNSLYVEHKLDDLHELLLKLNRDDTEYLDSLVNYYVPMYSLLYVVSKLVEGANLIPLEAGLIDPVKDLVLPIHSRPLFEGTLLLVDDPIGDYVALSDDINITPIKTLYSSLKMRDKFSASMFFKPTEIISFTDSYTQTIMAKFLDTIDLYDIFDGQRHSQYGDNASVTDSFVNYLQQKVQEQLMFTDHICHTDLDDCSYDSHKQYDTFNKDGLVCEWCQQLGD